MKTKKMLSLFTALSALMAFMLPSGTIAHAEEATSHISLRGPSLTEEIAAGSYVYKIASGIIATYPAADSEGNRPFGVDASVQVYKNGEWSDYEEIKFGEGTYRLKMNVFASSDCDIRYRVSTNPTVTYNGDSCTTGNRMTYAVYAYTEAFNTVPQKQYSLMIDGIVVTNANASDILGNGVFAYDEVSETLTVNGNYTSEHNIIYNIGINGLTIDVTGDSVLTCTGEQRSAINCGGYDTKITGSGKLNAGSGKSCAIYAPGSSTLTIEDANVEASGLMGIFGQPASEKLVIKNSRVLAGGRSGAIGQFGGGITLDGCAIDIPSGGDISSYQNDHATWYQVVDESGKKAIIVRILPDGEIVRKPEAALGLVENISETTARVQITDLAQETPVTVIVAQYKDGILNAAREAQAQPADLADGIEMKFKTDLNAEYRAFVWDEKLKPLTDKVKYRRLEITEQVKKANVYVGDDAVFTVQAAGGNAPYTYEWYYRTKNDSQFFNCKDRAEYHEWFGGIGTNSLTVHQLDSSLEGSEYYCVITDADGNAVTSDTALLNVHTHMLEIIGYPLDVTVAKGADAEFGVAFYGGRKPYTIDWYYQYADGTVFYHYKDKVEYYLWFETVNTDSETHLKVHQHNDSLEGSKYYCVITDAEGSTVTSPVAALIVENKIKIETQPQSYSAAKGNNVDFFVSVNGGKTPYTFQWYYCNAGETSFTRCEDAAEWYARYRIDNDGGNYSLLTVKEAGEYMPQNGAMYYCVITDAAGNSVVSDTAVLTLTQ